MGWSRVGHDVGSQAEIDAAVARAGRSRRSRAARPRSRRRAGCRSDVDGERAAPRRGDGREEGAGLQVVGPDLGAGRDVEALAGAATGRQLSSMRLGSMAAATTGTPEVARGGYVVLAPQDEPDRPSRTWPDADASIRRCRGTGRSANPGGTRWRSGRGRPRRSASGRARLEPVGRAAPSTRRRARSTNHRSSRSRRPPPSDRRSALRSGRIGSIAEPCPEPADDAELLEAGTRGPGRRSAGGRGGRPRAAASRDEGTWRAGVRRRCGGRWRGGRGCGGRSWYPRRRWYPWRRARRPEPRPPRAARRPAGLVARVVLDRSGVGPSSLAGHGGGRELVLEALDAHRRGAGRTPRRMRVACSSENSTTTTAGSRIAGPDPEPVRDRRVVRVERGQDDVHVGEGRHGQDQVGDPPAPRDRGQDDAHREERVAVPLVDAGRDHEEGEGEDRQPDQQRQAVRTAGDDDEDDDDRRPAAGPADDDGRDRSEDGDARAAVLGGAGVVAHPRAGVGEALAEVRRDERPRVVGVDGQVRVAAGGDRRPAASRPDVR